MRAPKKVRGKLEKGGSPSKGGRAMERMTQFKKARGMGGDACESSKPSENAQPKKRAKKKK